MYILKIAGISLLASIVITFVFMFLQLTFGNNYENFVIYLAPFILIPIIFIIVFIILIFLRKGASKLLLGGILAVILILLYYLFFKPTIG